MTQWTAAKDQFMRAAIDLGVSHADIARKLGTTRNATIGRANRLGLKHPYAHRPSHAVVKGFRRQGLTYHAIAALTGYSAGWVGCICRGEV